MAMATGQKAHDATGVNSTTTTFVDSNTSVLLQTAQVLVSNPGNPEHKINAHLIFDTGSQRSYVSEGLREEMSCPTVKTETLMIKTFGTTTGELKSHNMVKVCIQGLNSEEIIDVHAYAVNTVCVPLENQAVQFAAENYPHLRDLPMADSCANSELSDRPVNILIGADHYWSFFTGGMSRGESGPVALETSLGWVLSGAVPDAPSTESTQVNITTLRVDTEKCPNLSDRAPEWRELEEKLTQF